MNWRQLPNALTGVRLALAPLLVAAIVQGQPRPALGLLFVAAVSDALDGFLARRFGWLTRLGSLLDPLADKLLLNACFIGLWVVAVLPGWLLALVLGRDLLIIVGAFAYHRLIRPVTGSPSLLGKLTTALQILLGLALLLQLGYGWPPSQWLEIGIWTVALVTAASGVDYVWRWGRRAWRERGAADTEG
jgi:cardiolipin synthase (CMP-forming)